MIYCSVLQKQIFFSLSGVSSHILSELQATLIKRFSISGTQATRLTDVMNLAFPEAMSENYEKLIPLLELPDSNDRHVLAAAIKENANLIITQNLKDFPSSYLESYGLAAKSPDDFLVDIIDLDAGKAKRIFVENVVLKKKKPPINEYELLDKYRKIGLLKTANYLHALL
ncbi:MAG: PIN domain-containing protein [Bacteroidota bacterium]